MPTSHIREIVAVHAPTRKVTGSSDIPLSAKGVQHAHNIAPKIPADAQISSSPMSRARDTARIVAKGKGVRIDSTLAPWALGAHEGKPPDQERPGIHALITKEPDKNPGVSEFSGKQGESFNDFRKRMLWGVRHKAANLKPGETKVDVTHGRNMHLTNAWLKKGAPDDLSIDPKAMTDKSVHVPAGSLARIDVKGKKMEPVQSADKPGYYQLRHGDTEWNAGQETGS